MPNLQTRYNQVVGNLSEANQELMYLRRYWSSLTTPQKNGIKTKMANIISDNKDELDLISEEITNLPD